MIDFSQITGSQNCPIGTGGSLPVALDPSAQELKNGLNPLQYVPGVGMIYRAATGAQIPSTMRMAGAAVTGGPLGVLGAAFMGLVEELVRMGPDTSRPAVPAGMSLTGSQSGVEPVTPGTLAPGAYTTLATDAPQYLTNTPNALLAQQRGAAYQVSQTWGERYPTWSPNQGQG